MTAWRLARSLQVLRGGLDAAHPGRDRASDGTIGDARHQAQQSDHNPNAAGVVRALDVDAGPGLYPVGPDRSLAVELAERVRLLGQSGFPALQDGGYVIWDGRIASEVQDWTWRPYFGDSPHREHVHISVSRDAARYDSELPWVLAAEPVPVPAPTPTPVVPAHRPAQLPPSVKPTPVAVPVHSPTVDLRLASGVHLVTGTGVRALQVLLELAGCLHGPADGRAGTGTRAALVNFQHRHGLAPDAVAGPLTWSALLAQ